MKSAAGLGGAAFAGASSAVDGFAGRAEAVGCAVDAPPHPIAAGVSRAIADAIAVAFRCGSLMLPWTHAPAGSFPGARGAGGAPRRRSAVRRRHRS